MNKITKIVKLKETNNDMAHNYYYLVYGRLYNEDKTKYRKVKFVGWFDSFDFQEYYEKDVISLDDIKRYVWEWAYNTIDMGNFNNYKSLIEFCNESIERYNGVRA